MAENIKLEVVTPEQSVVSEDVQIAMAPGELGEFGVLSGHTTFLSTLKVGTLSYKDEGGKEKFVFISGGYAEVLPDQVTVLAESAERREDIDVERAKAASERAQSRLASEDKEDIDLVRAQAALERAIHRIKCADTR
ncbi:F0F1 ATP synthase subunit epsilon [Thermodesulfobacteriota bacterium]